MSIHRNTNRLSKMGKCSCKCKNKKVQVKVGKKGSKSKTQKGRKNFTTKKTSKYHVVGGRRVKALGKPYSRRCK